jgi:hypothetical protein
MWSLTNLPSAIGALPGHDPIWGNSCYAVTDDRKIQSDFAGRFHPRAIGPRGFQPPDPGNVVTRCGKGRDREQNHYPNEFHRASPLLLPKYNTNRRRVTARPA